MLAVLTVFFQKSADRIAAGPLKPHGGDISPHVPLPEGQPGPSRSPHSPLLPDRARALRAMDAATPGMAYEEREEASEWETNEEVAEADSLESSDEGVLESNGDGAAPVPTADVEPYEVAWTGNRLSVPPSSGGGLGSTVVGDLVPLVTALPEALFEGIKRPIKLENLEPVEREQPPLLVPRGVRLLSEGKPVISSDPAPTIGALAYLTDGDKGAADGRYVELGPRKQWVQIDLEHVSELYGIWIWHYHKNPRAYIDVVVQVSNDAHFSPEATATIYNADHDNTCGFGPGRHMTYVETHRGRVVDAGGLGARYVRLYSNGNTSNDMNHYVEVEVWGLSGA